LDDLLQQQAKGYSLHALYQQVPEALKGYVELVYDLNNHPSFRLIEPLLYRSRYYDRSLQSLMLSLITGDDRPFVLSTPRLDGDDLVHLQVPFDAPAVDDLFRLKSTPKLWCEIESRFDVPERSREVFRSFFTPDPPRRYQRYDGDGVRWRYFGHACILIETKSLSLLFDPVLSYTYESDVSRYTYLDLPERIDYVLITHNHQDHVLFETLLQLRHKIGTVIVPKSGGGSLQDPSLKLTLKNVGFPSVIELGELDAVALPDGSVTALPFLGEHSDLDVRSKAAYLVRLGEHHLLFAADSCNIEPQLYEHLHGATGDIDALFVGMECDGAPLTWLYGPLLTRSIPRGMDESRRLAGSNYDQAVSIVNRFNCREVYVYAMGQEPWLNYVMSLKYTPESRPIVESNRLIADCQSRGIVAERLFGEKEILLN
jgi:L-ascorbate metabolism protein UlaG (beta-lactamase superfamily)